MRSNKAPEHWESRVGISYLTPLQILDLENAVREGRKTFQMLGRPYRLVYADKNYERVSGTNSRATSVFYIPTDNRSYTPTGWVNIKRLLEG